MTKATILIVEDEAIVAEDLPNKLGRLGYEVSGITARARRPSPWRASGVRTWC